MLNTFPNLLVLGFFAPTLLRVAVACLFFYASYSAYKHRDAAAHLRFPLIGEASWAGGFTVLIYIAFGLMLLLGYYTQIAALLAGLTSIKGLFFCKRFGPLFPYSRSTYLLILIICLSLLATGAGAMAFDLPL